MQANGLQILRLLLSVLGTMWHFPLVPKAWRLFGQSITWQLPFLYSDIRNIMQAKYSLVKKNHHTTPIHYATYSTTESHLLGSSVAILRMYGKVKCVENPFMHQMPDFSAISHLSWNQFKNNLKNKVLHLTLCRFGFCSQIFRWFQWSTEGGRKCDWGKGWLSRLRLKINIQQSSKSKNGSGQTP